MSDAHLLERISAKDWEATPASVRSLLLTLLPLETEVSELRTRLHSGSQTSATPSEEETVLSRHRQRYHFLVDRLFLQGLDAAETEEMERLGAEIDAHNAPFYEAVFQRMETALNQKK